MTRITRFVPVDRDAKFLKGASGQICESFSIASEQELAKRIAAWEEGARLRPITKICPQPALQVAGIWDGGLPRVIHAGSAKARVLPAA